MCWDLSFFLFQFLEKHFFRSQSLHKWPSFLALLSLCPLVSILDERRKQQPDPRAAGLGRYWALLGTSLKPEKMEPALPVTKQQWEPDRWDCRQCISPVPACCHLQVSVDHTWSSKWTLFSLPEGERAIYMSLENMFSHRKLHFVFSQRRV